MKGRYKHEFRKFFSCLPCFKKKTTVYSTISKSLNTKSNINEASRAKNLKSFNNNETNDTLLDDINSNLNKKNKNDHQNANNSANYSNISRSKFSGANAGSLDDEVFEENCNTKTKQKKSKEIKKFVFTKSKSMKP